jgi:DNA-binding IclR family transcriptional regulator
MSRISPPTERVKRILSLLAAAGRPLTLTDIAKNLEINFSTCQVILNSLTEGGFITRSPKSRAYVLGPAMIRLGQAARSVTPISAVVEAEIDLLYEALGYGCTVLALVDDQMVVISQAGPADRFPVAAVALGPFPFVAPFGATIMAFRPQAEIEQWLKGAAEVEQALHLRNLLDTLRSYGVNVSLMTRETQLAMPKFNRLLVAVEQQPHLKGAVHEVLQLLAVSGSRWYLKDELKTRDQFSVSLITAPILTKHLSMELHLHVYESSLSAARLQKLVKAVKNTCTRIAKQASGDA